MKNKEELWWDSLPPWKRITIHTIIFTLAFRNVSVQAFPKTLWALQLHPQLPFILFFWGT